MRRRLLLSTLSVVAVSLLLLAAPLAFVLARIHEDRAFDSLQQEVEQAAAFVAERAGTIGDAQTVLGLAARASGTSYALVAFGGRVVVEAGDEQLIRPLLRDPLAAAARGRVVRADLDDRIAIYAPVGGDLDVLVGVRSDGAVDAAIRRALLQVALAALVVLGVAAAAAVVQGRRLAEPLEALADSARRLGKGDFAARAPRSEVPEVDAIAEALDATADRLGTALERSRTLAADASHQLRTPLTALQLELEALEVAGAHPETVGRAQHEADRLRATIDELLELTRPGVAASAVDVGEVAASRLAAWTALAEAEGREVVDRRLPVPAVRARPAAIGQALQVLLDNALEHGRGTITVETAPSAGDRGVRLSVRDEGPGLPHDADPLRDAAGRGLGLARQLVEAEGGHLVLERRGPGTRASILLPTSEGVHRLP